MERGPQRCHERSAANGSLEKRCKKKSGDDVPTEVVRRGRRRTLQVAKGGRGERRSSEDVARGDLRRSRARRCRKEAGEEVVTGGLRGIPKDVAREKLRKTRLREEAVRRGPKRSHARRSAREVAKG